MVFAEDGGLARGHNTGVLLYVTVLFGVVQHLGVNSLPLGSGAGGSNPLAPPILSSYIPKKQVNSRLFSGVGDGRKGRLNPEPPGKPMAIAFESLHSASVTSCRSFQSPLR